MNLLSMPYKSNLDLLLAWFYLFKVGKEISEYEDLNIQFNSLIANVERNRKITDEDDKEFYTITKNQRRRIISELIHELKDKKIEFSGNNFSDENKRIDEYRRKSEEDLDIEIYDGIIRNLMDIRRSVDRKIYQSKKTLIKSICIGILGSVIGGILLLILFWVKTFLLNFSSPF